MTVFVLKIIAMMSMILDHIKYAIPETRCFATEYLGRIAFPIFAFLVSEGFVHTHSRLKYILRMLVFAIVSQIPFYMFVHNIVNSNTNFNVMFTFEFALIGLWIIDYFTTNKELPKILKYIIVVICLAQILTITYLIHPDYSWYGVSVVWMFYIFRNSKILTSLSFTFLILAYYASYGLIKNYKMLLCNLIPLIFILLYKGKQGKKLKYFFYLFYPVHFIVLYLLSYI